MGSGGLMTTTKIIDKGGRRSVVLGLIHADQLDDDEALRTEETLDADNDVIRVSIQAGDGLLVAPVMLTIDLDAERETLERLIRKVAADLDLILDHFQAGRPALDRTTTAELALRGSGRLGLRDAVEVRDSVTSALPGTA
jgi:hypothetical protein